MRRKSDRFPTFIEKKYFDIGTYNRATGNTRKSIRCMKKIISVFGFLDHRLI